MKKVVLYIAFVLLALVRTPRADDDFFDNLIVDEHMQQEVKNAIEKEKAQTSAGEILDKKPLELKIDADDQSKIKKSTKDAVLPIEREMAPFGLKWLASKDEILELQVKLTPYALAGRFCTIELPGKPQLSTLQCS